MTFLNHSWLLYREEMWKRKSMGCVGLKGDDLIYDDLIYDDLTYDDLIYDDLMYDDLTCDFLAVTI